MCATCGCSDDHHDHGEQDDHAHHHHDHGEQDDHAHHHHDHGDHAHDHGHDHHDGHHHHGPHDHGDDHDHHHAPAEVLRRIRVEEHVLARNDLRAERNRGWFDGRRVLALNFVSSPGSGKTALLERTIVDRSDALSCFVVQGDQATDRDAERIRRVGARAVQLNTGTVCHLDAAMIAGVIAQLEPLPGTLVAIENVGNLVCPALFDLGEHARVVVASVAEGADKPIKYPYMFRSAQLVILNKIDLLPHVDFDLENFAACVRAVNRDAPIIELSATRGDGMAEWYTWLDARLKPLAYGGKRSGEPLDAMRHGGARLR